jgi:YesN/AraC family two-component response regulator
MADFIVVDDELLYRHLLRRFLEECGHTVRDAENGKIAMEMIRQKAPDVLVTDILMPEMEGLELIAKLRRSGNDCRVVAISGGIDTASGTFSYLESARLLGAVRTMRKPFSKREFIDVVEGVLEMSGRSFPAVVSG